MSILKEFKSHVASQFQKILGLDLTDQIQAEGNSVVWIEKEERAWLLDDDIGLALLIVPYGTADVDLNSTIQEAIRTATQLQPRYGITETEVDPCGMWQVGICWLIPSNLKQAWRLAVSGIRQKSGFSEEVGLDAVFIEDGEDVTAATTRHGLPQLLLHTRRLLGLGWTEMPGWLSANAKVAEMLKKFPEKFAKDTETYRLAEELVNDVLPMQPSETTDPSSAPTAKSLADIEITNFRNIKQFHLNFPVVKENARAHIIFGPNGTGKTSIFEAFCLATGGVSNTLVDYLDDEDVEPKQRSNYSSNVLGPLSGSSVPFEIVFGGQKKSFSWTDKSQSSSDWRSLEGSFQAQEDSRKFLDEKGESLAQRILKSYSTLADEVTKHAEVREQAAKDEKSNWLRSHDLSSAITRRETRAQKLIEGEIKKESWYPSQTLLDWLANTAGVFPMLIQESRFLAQRWQQWRDAQEECIASMAQGIALGESLIVRQALANWLASRNGLLQQTRTLVNRAIPFIDPLREKLQGVEQELDAWGEWLIRQTPQPGTNTSDEINHINQQIDQTRKNLNDLRQLFATERKHAVHLEKLKMEFLDEWTKSHPDICPTCEQDHHEHGGITHVVNTIKDRVDAQLAEYEQQGKALAATLAEMEAKLASFGICPVNQQRQSELEKLLSSFRSDNSLQTLLANPMERNKLKSNIQMALRLPPVQEPLENPDEIAGQIAERCISLDAEAERLWPLPERWADIVKALRKECDAIVEKHLPETLQKLWWETALALTSARWNLQTSPIFQIKGRRNTQKLIIGVAHRKDTPARYLFNQAERHIMGLAWFFARHITHGRFHRSFIVLDDPAQEMDQTTFRTFSRFTQALLRLQEKKRVKLDMLLFLHQEDRALDIARATLGRFIMLPWRDFMTDGKQNEIKEIKLLSEGFRPQSAMQLLGHKTTIAL